METDIRTVEAVLGENRRYMIPIYQRKYQWNDELLTAFWDDVEAKALSVLEKKSEVVEGEESFQHYMGALILSHSEDKIDITPKAQVIDGQQRLTTFQIFLIALREVGKDNDLFASNIDKINKYIFNEPKGSDEDADAKFKLTPTPSDKQMFHSFVKNDYSDIRIGHKKFYRAGRVPKNTPRPALYAYEFFYKKINDFVINGPKDSYGELVNVDSDNTDKDLKSELIMVLLDTLLDHLKLVVIALGSDDDPQAIFETLNSKAAKLLAMDLVRNNIFHRAEKENINVDELYHRLWNPFDEDWWKEPAPSARPTRPRIDHFLANVLVAETGRDISVRDLYAEYKKFSVPRGNPHFNSIEEELNVLNNHAPSYEALENKSGSTESNPTLAWLGKKLATWQVSLAYPIAMQIANIEEYEKTIMSKLIYSYIVRRAVAGLTTGALNKNFQAIARAINKHGPSVATLVNFFADREKSEKNDSIRFPRNDEFKQGILSTPVYDHLGPAKTNDMLVEFEKCSRTNRTESINFTSPVSVEHVLPKSWTNQWPDANGEMVEWQTEDASSRLRHSLINTFGNLTLLTQPLNSSVSNKSFAEKKAAFEKDSLLVLNKHFLTKERWTEEEIKQRGEMLAEMAVNIWIDLL